MAQFDLTQLEGWIPAHIRWGQDGPVVDWCYLGERRLTAPFFDQDIEGLMRHPFHVLFRQQTSLDVLEELYVARPGVTPSGFIFHMSRCGSTLVSQMLAALPRNIVISEGASLDFVLHAHLYNPQITPAHRIAALQGLVSAWGQPRLSSAAPSRLFIKFACWHTLDLDLIQKAFPGVPWIFVYRDPLEVMVSNLRATAAQMLPSPVGMALLALSPAEISAMSLEEYLARYLARVCDMAVAHSATGRLVHYRELPEAVWTWLPEYFGVSYSAAELEVMRHIAQFNAKDPAQRFTSDSQSKRQEATPLTRHLTAQWIEPLYDRLEAARKFASQFDS